MPGIKPGMTAKAVHHPKILCVAKHFAPVSGHETARIV